MPNSRPLHAALLATTLLLTPVAALAQGASPPARVAVEAAEVRTMAPMIEVPGTVHSRQDAEIAAEVAGRVVWVAEAGTRVQAGDPIARLDDRVLTLESRGLEAQIESLKAQLDFQTREAERITELAKRGTAAQSRLEEVVSRRDVLAQELVQARVRLERVALDLERTVVKAPFAGQVAARMLEVGEFSSPGTRVARLVAVDDLEIRVQAPVAIADHLREGMAVGLSGEAGPAEGRIARIIAVGEERSRTFEVRIALPAGRWMAGGGVTVALPAAQVGQVTAVPRDALVLRGNGTFVYRVKADNTAERVPVRTGLSQGGWIEIDGAIAAGDRLVTRGAERLREGQPVDFGPEVG